MTAAAKISNRSLKEDIREYWSEKATVFDQSAGHRIEDQIEAPEWRKLLTGAIGDLKGKRVLDLGCGTGEKLLVIDGNWVRLPWYGGILRSIANRLRVDKNARDLNENDTHARIIAQVAYAKGLTFDALAPDIAEHGFRDVKAHSLRRIYWLGTRHASLGEQLKLKSWRRFTLSAVAG